MNRPNGGARRGCDEMEWLLPGETSPAITSYVIRATAGHPSPWLKSIETGRVAWWHLSPGAALAVGRTGQTLSHGC